VAFDPVAAAAVGEVAMVGASQETGAAPHITLLKIYTLTSSALSASHEKSSQTLMSVEARSLIRIEAKIAVLQLTLISLCTSACCPDGMLGNSCTTRRGVLQPGLHGQTALRGLLERKGPYHAQLCGLCEALEYDW
jgi:hypothetical protein